jgi:hypothetical protein
MPKPKDEPLKVAFTGIIKSIRTAIDVSGDTVAELDKLHKPDSSVFVVVMEKTGE